jgi:hypothetical protein
MKSAEFMQWVTAFRELDHHQRKLLGAALNQQSDELCVLELIEASFDAKNACPHCSGIELYRHGVVSGLQRYYCKHCHKTFNALTGTPLARQREKPKWLDYLALRWRNPRPCGSQPLIPAFIATPVSAGGIVS